MILRYGCLHEEQVFEQILDVGCIGVEDCVPDGISHGHKETHVFQAWLSILVNRGKEFQFKDVDSFGFGIGNGNGIPC